MLKKSDGKRQITIEKAREILGIEAVKYSDKELQEIIDRLYGIAESIFRLFYSEEN